MAALKVISQWLLRVFLHRFWEGVHRIRVYAGSFWHNRAPSRVPQQDRIWVHTMEKKSLISELNSVYRKMDDMEIDVAEARRLQTFVQSQAQELADTKLELERCRKEAGAAEKVEIMRLNTKILQMNVAVRNNARLIFEIDTVYAARRTLLAEKNQVIQEKQSLAQQLLDQSVEYKKKLGEMTSRVSVLEAEKELLRSHSNAVCLHGGTDAERADLLKKFESRLQDKSALLSHLQIQASVIMEMTNVAEEQAKTNAKLVANNAVLTGNISNLEGDMEVLLGYKPEKPVAHRFRNPLFVLSCIQEELVCAITTMPIEAPTIGPAGHVYELQELMRCWTHETKRDPLTQQALTQEPTLTTVSSLKNMCAILNASRME